MVREEFFSCLSFYLGVLYSGMRILEERASYEPERIC